MINKLRNTTSHADRQAHRCPYCDSLRIDVTACASGPHYSRRRCADCKRSLGYEPKPWTLERALTFQLPYGHWRGYSLSALAQSQRGRSYLGWAAREIDGPVGRAARIVVEGIKRGEVRV
jgi:hypothetical protein